MSKQLYGESQRVKGIDYTLTSPYFEDRLDIKDCNQTEVPLNAFECRMVIENPYTGDDLATYTQTDSEITLNDDLNFRIDVSGIVSFLLGFKYRYRIYLDDGSGEYERIYGYLTRINP